MSYVPLPLQPKFLAEGNNHVVVLEKEKTEILEQFSIASVVVDEHEMPI